MKRKRASLSKRTRFEIFKRDGFQCAYCGNTPPRVVLTIDHVTPHSKGGSDDIANLLTACSDCNSGKSDVPLSRRVKQVEEMTASEQERFDQVKAYNKLLACKRLAEDRWYKKVEEIWVSYIEGGQGTVLVPDVARSVRMFLKRMPAEQVIECLNVTLDRCRKSPDDMQFFKYFCGVCWRTIKENKH